MISSHPISKYGLALVMEQNDLQDVSDILPKHLVSSIIDGLQHFRLEPANILGTSDEMTFRFISYKSLCDDASLVQSTGLAKAGKYLNACVITEEKSAKGVFQNAQKLIEELSNQEVNFNANGDLTMSILPISAKFNNGKNSQSYPKVSLFERCCDTVATLTPYKPAMLGGVLPSCIIPDFDDSPTLTKTINFIKLFRMIQGEANLYISNGNKGEYKRPIAFYGNFPNAPRSFALKAAGLLAAIGTWVQRAETLSLVIDVLDGLKNATLYLVQYGKATPYTFHHHVIELAKVNKLKEVIDAIGQSTFYKENRSVNILLRDEKQRETQLFCEFASQFLQFYNPPSFQKFMSFRANYGHGMDSLFQSYFNNIMKIDKDVVQSAKTFGQWLNNVAYWVAKKAHENTKSDEFQKAKAKVLVEMESTAFSAKSGIALVAQLSTRAGRLTGSDVPSEASLFIERVCSEEVSLQDAQYLVVAFLRLRKPSSKGDVQDQELLLSPIEVSEDELPDISEN